MPLISASLRRCLSITCNGRGTIGSPAAPADARESEWAGLGDPRESEWAGLGDPRESEWAGLGDPRESEWAGLGDPRPRKSEWEELASGITLMK